jgi:hypothetical protein
MSEPEKPFKTISFVMMNPDLHSDTVELVCNFTSAVADKLTAAQEKYEYSNGWKDPSWMEECRKELLSHVYKGDPLDVAAYCAFLWYHKEPTFIKESN